MKCRKLLRNEETGSYDISFFNSVGLGKLKNYYLIEPVILTLVEVSSGDNLPNEDDVEYDKIYQRGNDYYIYGDTWIKVTIASSNPNNLVNVVVESGGTYTKMFDKAIIESQADFDNSKDNLYEMVYDDVYSIRLSKTKDVCPYNSKKPTTDSSSSYAANSSEMVANDLISKLSIIKGELWYNRLYGLPLLDKVRNKSFLDAEVLKIIRNQEGVESITSFESNVDNHVYNVNVTIKTIYGNITISV